MQVRDLTDDWQEHPPLVHLVEALVYGLAGGKPGAGTQEPLVRQQSLRSHPDLTDPLDFLRPPPASPVRGPGMDMSPQDVAARSAGIKPDPGLAFDMAEMTKRNQEMIANFARRKTGQG